MVTDEAAGWGQKRAGSAEQQTRPVQNQRSALTSRPASAHFPEVSNQQPCRPFNVT